MSSPREATSEATSTYKGGQTIGLLSLKHKGSMEVHASTYTAAEQLSCISFDFVEASICMPAPAPQTSI